jgi:hypothetical protein
MSPHFTHKFCYRPSITRGGVKAECRLVWALIIADVVFLAGNSSVTNITVVQSDVLLTIDDFSGHDLTTGAVNLTGYVSTGGGARKAGGQRLGPFDGAKG